MASSDELKGLRKEILELCPSPDPTKRRKDELAKKVEQATRWLALNARAIDVDSGKECFLIFATVMRELWECHMADPHVRQ